MEEKIQPHGLENPGEDLLSGLCLTCCHTIRLVGIQKDPRVIWTSVCVCPQKTAENTASSREVSKGAGPDYQRVLGLLLLLLLLSC